MMTIPRSAAMKKEKSGQFLGDLPQKEKKTWLIGEEAYAATLLGEGSL